MANDCVLEAVDQPASIRIIADDFLPGIAPRHHVIISALKFGPWSPWDAGGTSDDELSKCETRAE